LKNTSKISSISNLEQNYGFSGLLSKISRNPNSWNIFSWPSVVSIKQQIFESQGGSVLCCVDDGGMLLARILGSLS
jgi:hypothetical protein